MSHITVGVQPCDEVKSTCIRASVEPDLSVDCDALSCDRGREIEKWRSGGGGGGGGGSCSGHREMWRQKVCYYVVYGHRAQTYKKRTAQLAEMHGLHGRFEACGEILDALQSKAGTQRRLLQRRELMRSDATGHTALSLGCLQAGVVVLCGAVAP